MGGVGASSSSSKESKMIGFLTAPTAAADGIACPGVRSAGGVLAPGNEGIEQVSEAKATLMEQV